MKHRLALFGLGLALWFALPIHLWGQRATGCRDGTEQGFATVLQSDTLFDATTGEAVIEVLEGDELRVCGAVRERAVVTLWTFGQGYVLRRANLSEIHAATLRMPSENEFACTLEELDAIQIRYASLGQNTEMLLLARRRGMSLSTLAAIRSAAVSMMVKGIEPRPC